MIFGNIQGLISGLEQVVFDSEVTGSAAATITTGNILNGDADGWYTIILFMAPETTAGYRTLQFNGDSGANYGRRATNASSTTVADSASTGQTSHQLPYISSTEAGFALIKLYAKSGSVRLFDYVQSQQIAGTTVGQIYCGSGVWSNTADNLISLTASGGYGVGSRLIILKGVNLTTGTPTGIITTPYVKGSWVRLERKVFSGNDTGHTFSGLDGDRDVVYMLSAAIKSNAAGQYLLMKPNNNTSAVYGVQTSSGASTTVSASRLTSDTTGKTRNSGPTASGNYEYSTLILFARKDYVKPWLCLSTSDITGTTVGHVTVNGGIMNDTGTNITSIVISETLQTGSQLDLFALRPNG